MNEIAIGGSLLVFVAVFTLALYFVPSIIARNRKHYKEVVIINLFLGFTVLGWLAALALSVTSPEVEPPQIDKKNEDFEKNNIYGN